MNVCLVGNFQPDLPVNVKPWSTETHWAVSFEALGHHVLRLQENALPTNAIGTLRANGIDLLLYVRTWDCLSSDWRAVLSDPPPGVTTAAAHLDIWWGLERQGEIAEQAMFECQHVFTADGDHEAEWRQAGVRHHWLPPAVVDTRLVDERVPGFPNPDRWPYDVAFVGSRAHHPEGDRAAFVDFCRATWGDRFVHVGGDGDLPTMRGQELNDFYATVPVLVGHSLHAHPDTHYVSDRAYEAPGRGAFSVFPYLRFVADELRHVQSQVYYPAGDYDSMADIVAMWVYRFAKNPAMRPLLVDDGAKWMRTHASYTQRAATILEVLCAQGAVCAEAA